MSHTIILLQPTGNKTSRSFRDYESVAQSAAGICQLFEEKLKILNPGMRTLEYNIDDLFTFIDSHADVSALVYDKNVNAYIPYNKAWIKEQVLSHLRNIASSGSRHGGRR
ncbi:hypothetical protein WJX84_004577 [Apatococcus fuscideae]|uniref:Enhancer of rudimentary homolog n=1 Tax=Apatococcus fuscideae TaxID=2026836 RepID=A0AAW1SX40_9CHLO